MPRPKRCKYCNKDITGPLKYCSSECRTKAMKERDLKKYHENNGSEYYALKTHKTHFDRTLEELRKQGITYAEYQKQKTLRNDPVERIDREDPFIKHCCWECIYWGPCDNEKQVKKKRNGICLHPGRPFNRPNALTIAYKNPSDKVCSYVVYKKTKKREEKY